MTLDPFLRRHGRGAARLAIGSIEGGLSLARLAGRPVVFEDLIARLPGLVCLLAALLMAWSLGGIESATETAVPLLDRTRDESPLAIRIWQEPRAAEPSTLPSPSVPAPAPPLTEPRSADVLPAPTRPEIPLATSTSTPAPRRRDFDPRSLALQASRATTLPSISEPLPVSGVAGAAPSERPLARAAREPDLLRRAFLASTASPEHLPPPSEPEPPEALASTPRPPVSAPAHDPGLADSIRSELERWDEVPLDDLPDCTPGGRQDALKQQILRAVSFQRECSHPEGRYRFVQTRNLNAFLMWSHPNPNAPTRRDRDRDACDVLERALRCLGDASNEELSIR